MSNERIRADFSQSDNIRRVSFSLPPDKREGRTVKGTGILIKAGVCALALALVLTLKLLGDAQAPAVTVSSDTENESTEELGRLKFVELPGIIEVFSAGRLPLGVEYISQRTLSDGTVLCLHMESEQAVSTPVDCRVKEIMPLSGGLYRIALISGDMEFTYAGLISVSVEEGQGLFAGDTLGLAHNENALTVEVRSSGRPQLPADIFDIAGNRY